jgi:carboxymethylenebutenolidase
VLMEAKELERLWSEHLDAEFGSKDVEATLATMVDDAYVNHMPVNTCGHGKQELGAFYRDVFIPSWPDDLQMQPVKRVVGDNQIVDELHANFTHTRQMDWFLPGVARRTGRWRSISLSSSSSGMTSSPASASIGIM